MFAQKNFALKILGITIVVFILQNFIPGFTELFVLNQANIFTHPWMFFTAIFLHGSIAHLFFNMIALLIFGPMLEQQIGGKNFLLVYLIGGIVGNVIGIFFYPQALGASGAIMAMFGTLVVLMPRLTVLIYGIIPMPLWAMAVLWFLLDFFGSFTASSIGHIVHIAGLIYGLAFGFYLKRKIRSIPKKGSFFGRRTSRGNGSDNSVDEWIRRNS